MARTSSGGFLKPPTASNKNCMPNKQVSQFDSIGFDSAEGGPVVYPGELLCNIPNNCQCWRNLPFGSPATRNLILITGDASNCFAGGTDKTYLGTISPDRPDEPDDLAIFESCAILCTQSDVRVTPRFWVDPDRVDVIVCKKNPWDNQSPPSDCQPVSGQNTVSLPGGEIFAQKFGGFDDGDGMNSYKWFLRQCKLESPIFTPTPRIVLVARLKKAKKDAPVFLMESIDVDYDACEAPTTTTPAPIITTTTSAPIVNLCEKAACNFLEDTCIWSQPNQGNQWRKYVAQEVAGNEDTGVNAWLLQRRFDYPDVSNSPYHAVRLNPGEKSSMEVYDLIRGSDPVTMVMEVYEATDQADIKVCQNNNCEAVTNTGVVIEDRQWREVRVPINEDTQRLAIQGDNSGGIFFGAAGVKNVNFLDKNGQPLCQFV